jgi:hypothetical protein
MFPTVHSRTSTGQRIKSYDFRKMTGLLKTSFLYRLQHRKRNTFWGCSVGILPLRWIPKTWRTLLSFNRLLIQPHPTNGLEDTEFWRSISLLISVSGQNCGWTELNFWVSDWPKLWKSQIPLQYPTFSAFRWSIIRVQTVSDLWATVVRNLTGLLNQNSGQTRTFGLIPDFDEISPWPP